ncbi:hypothetical protein Hypma_004653 [Hypsizygus marmoreus]|uniref:Major facilitator superfamily (MFS) profile domain-containing protein n=1 Tax=Hypsizygus marmoreus TaxID=39966 RepID=A0A369J792_HYPMA|nr:hypothetical protein Hypma_004653 [Hypsizygus marmoreus]
MSFDHEKESSEEKASSQNVVRVDLDVATVELGTEAERRLLRKLDWTLIPLFTLIFCLNFVDRTAIGNAKIAGLEKDLHMHGFDYNVMLTIFYVLFVFLEVPCNLALKRFGSIFLALMVIVFGLATLCTAFVKSYSGLIVTRVFLAMAEAGTLPGLTYILSRFYRRSEFVLRVGMFFGVAPCIAGAFGGLLSSGILATDDIGSIKSWRKIFLVEGIITTGFGSICVFIIPADPQHTRMFNPAERALALARIDADQPVRTQGRKEPTSLALVWRAFNFNSILCALAYLMINISFQGLAIFLPTVVSNLGKFTTVQAQLRTVPPYLVAICWVLGVSYLGYRLKKRFIPILMSMPLVVIGYALSVGTKDTNARYAACFLAIAGLTPSAPVFLAWGTDNAAPDTVRAATTAVIPCIGGLGAIIAVWTYIPSDAPDYYNGNSLNLATSSAVCCLAVIGALYVRWENGKRERGERDHRLEGKSREEIEQLGSLHPSFRYQI